MTVLFAYQTALNDTGIAGAVTNSFRIAETYAKAYTKMRHAYATAPKTHMKMCIIDRKCPQIFVSDEPIDCSMGSQYERNDFKIPRVEKVNDWMQMDESWIRAHLPEDLRDENINVFSGLYLDGLKVMSYGERGNPDEVRYEAKSEEDLRWWQFNHVFFSK